MRCAEAGDPLQPTYGGDAGRSRFTYPGRVTSADISRLLDHAAEGGRITPDEALLLYTDAPLHALGQAADAVRRRRYPDNIATYIIDRNINYTNVCVTACKFCAFYRAPEAHGGLDAPDWRRSCAAAARRSTSAPRRSCCRAATRPSSASSGTSGPSARSSEHYPQLVLHSLGASEVVHIGQDVGPRLRDGDHAGCNAAGLDSFAGAGAEILVKRPRTAIAPLKESGETWLEVMETAHGLGVESTATFMMGTGETNAERIEHLRMIRDVQDRTGGFRSFIPWTYQPENNHLKGRTQATSLEYLRHGRGRPAVLRQRQPPAGLVADDRQGHRPAHAALRRRRPRLGHARGERGLVGRRASTARNRTELIELIRGAGRIPAQRDTLYRHLVVHADPADDPVDDRVQSHFSSTVSKLLPIAAAS